MANKGRLTYKFERLRDVTERKRYDHKTGNGLSTIFEIRKTYDDFLFIHTFVNQDFVDRYSLFVAGRKLNRQKGVWEIYVKSRNAQAYRQMIEDSLYHPPRIELDETKMKDGCLYLNHVFEGKPLVKEFIPNTMMGIEFLWGAPVKLETTEIVQQFPEQPSGWGYWGNLALKSEPQPDKEPKYQRVLYTMKERKIKKTVLGEGGSK